MEAIKFIKERDRMCRTYDDCKGCPLEVGDDCTDFPNGSPERAAEIVEHWSKTHKGKTRQSEFLKLYPDAKLNEEGVMIILPCQIDKKFFKGCENCIYEDADGGCERAYWSEEIDND